jgi:C-methyltransferase-like protein
LQYDTIYHEHLRYYSLTSLTNLLQPHGLRIFHVTRIPTHGGSIRVYATRSDLPATDASVECLLGFERDLGLASPRWISDFTRRVVHSKLRLYELLAPLIAADKRVYGIGAPSRASTLVTYVGIGRGIMECVLEVPTSKKIDMYLPGTNVAVMDEARLYAAQPEYALLLSWHIADELYVNLKRAGYLGDFIVPLPEPRIVSNADADV